MRAIDDRYRRSNTYITGIPKKNILKTEKSNCLKT